MDGFERRDGELWAEGVRLHDLAARFGTPLYVYSEGALRARYAELTGALAAALPTPPLVAHSVKANPNLALIRLLARAGAGADVVSGGELERALRAGVPAERIVFSGTGKREDELQAAVAAGVFLVNVEVEDELDRLDALARAAGRRQRIALRVNPDVEAATHRYITVGTKLNKFGLPLARARALYRRAAGLAGLEVHGVACHIASQMLDLGPLARALGEVRQLVEDLRQDGIALEAIDVGGGLGVRYLEEDPPGFPAYAAVIREQVGDLGARIVLEPGRSLVANAGLLLTRVLYRKEAAAKRFLVVDAAMNDFQRPALYGGRHGLAAVRDDAREVAADVVGPICESGDFLTQDRAAPDLAPGELLCLLGAGAYGRSMASNYNTRPRAAEVLARGDEAHVIQERETLDQLLQNERFPPHLS